MIRITFEADTLPKLNGLVAEYLKQHAGGVDAPAPAASKPAATKGAAAAAAKAPGAPAPAADPAPAEAAATAQLTLVDVNAATSAAAAKDRPKVIAVLASFGGAKNTAGLKADQYAAYVAKLKAEGLVD